MPVPVPEGDGDGETEGDGEGETEPGVDGRAVPGVVGAMVPVLPRVTETRPHMPQLGYGASLPWTLQKYEKEPGVVNVWEKD